MRTRARSRSGREPRTDARRRTRGSGTGGVERTATAWCRSTIAWRSSRGCAIHSRRRRAPKRDFVWSRSQTRHPRLRSRSVRKELERGQRVARQQHAAGGRKRAEPVAEAREAVEAQLLEVHKNHAEGLGHDVVLEDGRGIERRERGLEEGARVVGRRGPRPPRRPRCGPPRRRRRACARRRGAGRGLVDRQENLGRVDVEEARVELRADGVVVCRRRRRQTRRR